MTDDSPTTRWVILTGEYPPQLGGVSDYTRLLARGLAHAGDGVCVWAPPTVGPILADAGVEVRRLPDRYGPQALYCLDAALRREPRNFRLLIQYVPHMYGWKAMNVPFCAWLRWGCPVRPWVMFHEVAYPVAAGQRLRHNLLGVVNRWMANTVARAAEKIFVAVPSWSRLLRRIAPQHNPAVWLPVPSNVPTTADPAPEAAVRPRLGP